VSDTITVLFVDDEPAVLSMVRRLLRDLPFDILTADDAVEALTLLRRRRVDVLVSDIEMPGMSGLELVRVARREFPGTLRMLMTGAATLDRVLDAINEGEVHRFFTKPFDGELFSRTLWTLVERIEKLRQEGEQETRRARREELYRWVDSRFPGTLDVQRGESGEVLIPVGALDRSAEAAGWRKR